MVPRFRPTLWRRLTTPQHVQHTLWDAGTFTGRHGLSPNDSKARVLKVFASCYWPEKKLVTAWLRDNWDALKSDPPPSTMRAARASSSTGRPVSR